MIFVSFRSKQQWRPFQHHVIECAITMHGAPSLYPGSVCYCGFEHVDKICYRIISILTFQVGATMCQRSVLKRKALQASTVYDILHNLLYICEAYKIQLYI